MADASKVFLIFGRNNDARSAMEQFLRALRLDPIDFDQISGELGGTPFIGDIVRRGMEVAQGIIALFTPDEFAALREEYRYSHDSASDKRRWQARPNVIFEAGMAFGMAPDRTILVTVGSEVALFSDVAGIHVLRLSNSAESRARLRTKLIGIRCSVDQASTAWLAPDRSGDFERCLPAPLEVGARDPFPGAA